MNKVIENYRTIGISHVFNDLNISMCNLTTELIQNTRGKLFFIGNGGSQCICQHMAEDFSKVANIPSMSLDGSGFITCLSNDYGYDNLYIEWLKRFFNDDDLLICISSSGESGNIINAARFVGSDKCVTLTARQPQNTLRRLGKINFYIPTLSYGIAECYHQLILHMILDKITQ